MILLAINTDKKQQRDYVMLMMTITGTTGDIALQQ